MGDKESDLYYCQSRYYDPAIGRFINADSLASTGQGLLGYNTFAYCGNNPVLYIDVDGCAQEEADEGYRVVGAGIQVEIGYGIITGGIEIIIYWDVEECGDNLIVAVYTYGGYSLDLTNPQIAPIITTIVNNSDAIMANPEEGIIQIISVMDNSYSVSVSGVILWGNDLFTSVKSYEGMFLSASGSIGHFKGGGAYSDSCIAIALGKTSSKTPSLGISVTNYTLRGILCVEYASHADIPNCI